MTGCYEERSESAVVVGVDTAMGFALAHALHGVGFGVVGLGEAAESPCPALLEYRRTDYAAYGIPDDCNLVLFCHDAASHVGRHAAALEALCRELASRRSFDNQVHVCVFTPVNACGAEKSRVHESDALRPHTLRELAFAQAEMTLHAWCSLTRMAILPNVIRHGELYADMPDELPLAGHVNACLRKVRRNEPLEAPGLGMQRRTLTHLDDFSAMVAILLRQDFVASPVNIPGETFSILEYMISLDRHSSGEMAMGTQHDEDLPWGLGDRVVSAALFRSERKYAPRHRFRKWAASLPDKAPELKGFDLAEA